MMMRWQSLSILVMVLVLEALGCAAQPPANLLLWYDKPGRGGVTNPQMDMVLPPVPIGNGRLGAMIYGGIDREHLQFNEDSLWVGSESDTGAYQAFGDVYIDLESGGPPRLVKAECASGQGSREGQTVEMTIDGSAVTKWCVENFGKPVVWVGHFNKPFAVSKYAFTSSDMADRDPKAWTLEGSTDGKTWTVLDQHADEPPHAKRSESKQYTFDNNKKFLHYRFTFPVFHSPTHFQLAEVELGRKEDAVFATAQPAVTHYRRELDIGRAIHTVSYDRDGIHFRRECFASHQANVMVLRLTADKPGVYNGSVSLTDMHKAAIAALGDRLTASGLIPGANGLKYESQVKVLHEGGTLEATDGRIDFSHADSLTLFINAGTDYLPDRAKGWHGENPHERITRQIDTAAKQPFESLLKKHVDDYQRIFNRVQLDLGTTAVAQRDLTTGERLKQYQHDVGDPELEALVFQFGRYLLISCSRDNLPANLQGLWNDSNNPPWRCDFHGDINIEMNYWPADSTNMSECFTPLSNWVMATHAVHTEHTKAAFHTRGWITQYENGIFGGGSWNWMPGSSAWMCQNLWDHYAFTQDRQYLKEIYPALKGVCEFWEDYLKVLPDGTLVSPNNESPEHGPPLSGPNTCGVTFDQELVWDAFTNYMEASQALGVDADYRAKVAAMRDRLLKPKIGKWGQLQEWMADLDSPDEQHRHCSHLVGLYPGRQISALYTPALAKAAAVSLAHRGEQNCGWSVINRIGMWARLLDGDHAYSLVHLFLHTPITYTAAAAAVYPNLLDSCPPFMIEGNFGYVSGVTEMLLQSHNRQGDDYLVELLPALPKAWPTGFVKGLRARGGYTVEFAWENGKIISYHIHAAKAATVAVRVNGEIKQVVAEVE